MIFFSIVDLSGTKDGVNTTFLLPAAPVPDSATLLINHNGAWLYPVSATPGVGEYSRIGATVTLGLAPEAGARLWARMGIAQAVGPISGDIRAVRKDFYYFIELRNRDGDLIEILQNDVFQHAWQYSSEGGCGDSEIALRRSFDRYGDIDIDYDVQVWQAPNPIGLPGARLDAQLDVQLGTAFTGSRQLRYSGFVRELEVVLDDNESVRLRCSGYSRQLETAIVPQATYADMDVGAIARDIIDQYVVPNTKIMRTAIENLVQDTGVVVQSVTFDCTAYEALKSLAEIGGNVEWGVRADREIFFVPRAAEVKNIALIGNNVKYFSSVKTADDIVHRVHIRGRSGFAVIVDGAPADPGFLKQRIMQLPFIDNTSDATLWGTAYFSRYGSPTPRGRVIIGAEDLWVESVGHPLGLLRVMGWPQFVIGGARFDSALPFLLGEHFGAETDQLFRIATITYTPAETTLTIAVDLGERGLDLHDYLKAIEYKLSELRQGL